MRRISYPRWLPILMALWGSLACNGKSSTSFPPATSGGSVPAAGQIARTGGAGGTQATGGSVASSGGTHPTGGVLSSGGQAGGGGAGGLRADGGTTGGLRTGGAAAGGLATGGVPTGGISSLGGIVASGGSATGGTGAGGAISVTALASCRGVVAVQASGGVHVSWRAKATDPTDLAFNVYRNSTKVNDTPLTGATSLLDAGGSAGAAYSVKPVVKGVEEGASESFTALATNYIRIPLDTGGTTQGGRLVGVGDLDGDCTYDYVLKRSDGDRDVTQADPFPNETIKLEAYSGKGQFLWRRDVGYNIRPGVWFSPFVVYDLDGDGKAEIALKASEVSTEMGGDGDINKDGVTDYRTPAGDVNFNEHPDVEYLEIWNGQTGKTLARAPWIPVGPWGKDGWRFNRNQMGVAYLDGQKPSVVITRGGNSRDEIHAYDFRDGKLTRRWVWSVASGDSNYGHNVRAGDIDGDGKDEFLFFNVAIDDDGSRVLWNTQEKHGDRFHLSDIDPDRPGMEIFYIQEFGGVYAHPVSLRDARTGAVIWGPTGNWGDVGRGLCANIDASHRGIECWASAGELYNAKGTVIGPRPNTPNMAIWWDGDREREIIDGTTISKWNGSRFNSQLSATGCAAGNRNIPMAVADTLGDWREEAVWVCNNTTELRVYVTPSPTSVRLPTLMQDPEYRTGVGTMTSGYVQSAHPSYYIGSDMTPPPSPRIAIPAGR